MHGEPDSCVPRIPTSAETRSPAKENPLPSIDDAINTQVKNIEAEYGKTLGEWFEVIAASELVKHNAVVAMLKDKYGLRHGAAHRVSLLSRRSGTPTPAASEFLEDLYSGKRAPLRAIHDALIALLDSFEGQFETVPKRGYVSLRRAKQFALIKPSTTTRVDLGLILDTEPVTQRLESAAAFNALFTHRVRLTHPREIDRQLQSWLREAYERAA